MSCAPSTLEINRGDIIYLAPCVYGWDELENKLDNTLSQYKDCDILTDKTARRILDNNDKLSK
jgi:hypothetical protein